jgi:hypothetical protein
MPKFINKDVLLKKKCIRYCSEQHYCCIHINCNKFNRMSYYKNSTTNEIKKLSN